MNKVFKNKRYYDLTIALNPFSWFNKPHYYRYDWQSSGSSVREGQLDFGPFSFSWYREPKKIVSKYNCPPTYHTHEEE